MCLYTHINQTHKEYFYKRFTHAHIGTRTHETTHARRHSFSKGKAGAGQKDEKKLLHAL